MEQLFRVNDTLEHDPAIDSWFDKALPILSLVARPWFEEMRSCGKDVREVIHDGCPVACVEDAPFGYVNIFTSHVNVGFYHGNALEDPMRILVGSGKRMRHVKLAPGRDVKPAALRTLIKAAYADIKARLERNGFGA